MTVHDAADLLGISVHRVRYRLNRYRDQFNEPRYRSNGHSVELRRVITQADFRVLTDMVLKRMPLGWIARAERRRQSRDRSRVGQADGSLATKV